MSTPNNTETETAAFSPSPCSHRSFAFWYSDTEDAGAKLVEAAMQYPPEERENFLRDAYRGAKVQLAGANDKVSQEAGENNL